MFACWPATAANQHRACRVILSKMFLGDETQSSERLPPQIRLWTCDRCWVDGAVSNLKHVHLGALRASSHSARGFFVSLLSCIWLQLYLEIVNMLITGAFLWNHPFRARNDIAVEVTALYLQEGKARWTFPLLTLALLAEISYVIVCT